MWDKGAVVILKRGDEAMADSIEDAMTKSLVPLEEMEKVKRENFFLKRQNSRNNSEKIAGANYFYEKKRRSIHLPKIISDFYAITIYGLSEFTARFLTIRER